VSDWIENKFCPDCGTFLKKKINGDTYCDNCGYIIYNSHKIDLNEIEKDLIDYSTLNEISERINNRTGYRAQYQFTRLLERFGIALTKYYETHQTQEVYDYSRNTGYGYDILSKNKKSRENRYIEVKTSMGKERSVTLSLNEFNFITKEISAEKWLYITLLDRWELLTRNYFDCFEFFKIPSTKLDESFFEFVDPSKPTLRYNSWRPAAERCRVTLPDELEIVLQRIREEYIKLYPEKAYRTLKPPTKLQYEPHKDFNMGYHEPGNRFYRKNRNPS
jgi:hypothetical protein